MGGDTEQSSCGTDLLCTTAGGCSVGGNKSFFKQVIVSCAFVGSLKGTAEYVQIVFKH